VSCGTEALRSGMNGANWEIELWKARRDKSSKASTMKNSRRQIQRSPGRTEDQPHRFFATLRARRYPVATAIAAHSCGANGWARALDVSGRSRGGLRTPQGLPQATFFFKSEIGIDAARTSDLPRCETHNMQSKNLMANASWATLNVRRQGPKKSSVSTEGSFVSHYPMGRLAEGAPCSGAQVGIIFQNV